MSPELQPTCRLQNSEKQIPKVGLISMIEPTLGIFLIILKRNLEKPCYSAE